MTGKFLKVFCLLGFLLALCSCEKSSVKPQIEISPPAIINGEIAKSTDSDKSAVVAIGYNSPQGFKPFCTGTLISTNLVITDAHCISDDLEYKTLADVLVYFGSDLNNFDSALLRKVENALIHPDYYVEFNDAKKAVSTWNDLALIKLQANAPTPARTISLASFGSLFVEGTELSLYGWGLLSSRPDLEASALYTTRVKLHTYWRGHILHDSRLERTGFCNGDSGGPAFVKIAQQTVLAGLIRGPHFPYPNCQGFEEITALAPYQDFILLGAGNLKATPPKFEGLSH